MRALLGPLSRRRRVYIFSMQDIRSRGENDNIVVAAPLRNTKGKLRDACYVNPKILGRPIFNDELESVFFSVLHARKEKHGRLICFIAIYTFVLFSNGSILILKWFEFASRLFCLLLAVEVLQVECDKS